MVDRPPDRRPPRHPTPSATLNHDPLTHPLQPAPGAALRRPLAVHRLRPPPPDLPGPRHQPSDRLHPRSAQPAASRSQRRRAALRRVLDPPRSAVPLRTCPAKPPAPLLRYHPVCVRLFPRVEPKPEAAPRCFVPNSPGTRTLDPELVVPLPVTSADQGEPDEDELQYSSYYGPESCPKGPATLDLDC